MGRRIVVEVVNELVLDEDHYRKGYEAGIRAVELDFRLPSDVDRLTYYKGLIEGYVMKKLLAGEEPEVIGVDVATQIYNNDFPLDSRLSIDEVLSFSLPTEVKNSIKTFVETLETWGQ